MQGMTRDEIGDAIMQAPDTPLSEPLLGLLHLLDEQDARIATLERSIRTLAEAIARGTKERT